MPTFSSVFVSLLSNIGARGGAVVEALRYKPDGRGIDSLPVALWPWDRLSL
jgi:hypothetical protein